MSRARDPGETSSLGVNSDYIIVRAFFSQWATLSRPIAKHANVCGGIYHGHLEPRLETV